MPFGFTRQSEINDKRYEDLKASVAAYLEGDDDAANLAEDLRRVVTDLREDAQEKTDKLISVEANL